MPLSKKKVPLPRNHLIFDPWNTGFSGHEHAQYSYNTKTAAYRNVRTDQLRRQFRRMSSVAVSDSVHMEEVRKKREKGEGGDIREFMGGQRKPITLDECLAAKTDLVEKPQHVKAEVPNENHLPLPLSPPIPTPTATSTIDIKPENSSSSSKIFHSLTFFINGSTFPLVSDHKLRHIIAEHGGALSISLARRSVTHVIIASPSSAGTTGARRPGGTGGGGLSAVKLQKEIATTAGRKGGLGVKFVGVDW